MRQPPIYCTNSDRSNVSCGLSSQHLLLCLFPLPIRHRHHAPSHSKRQKVSIPMVRWHCVAQIKQFPRMNGSNHTKVFSSPFNFFSFSSVFNFIVSKMTNEDVIGFICVVPVYGFHLETERWKERIITSYNIQNEIREMKRQPNQIVIQKRTKNIYFLRFRFEM